MSEGQSDDSGSVLAAAVDKLKVADSLETLRVEVERLIGRIQDEEGGCGQGASQSTDAGPAGAHERAERPGDAGDSGLDVEIGALGRKVEAAGELLAEFTDVLEAQTERLETIEQQLGDPDADAGFDAELGACSERLERLESLLIEVGSFAPPQEMANSAEAADSNGLQERIDELSARIRVLEQSRGTTEHSRSVVMVVDARPRPRGALSLDLSRTGFHVLAACDAASALRRLERRHVDAALLQASLPPGEIARLCEAMRPADDAVRGLDTPCLIYGQRPGGLSESDMRALVDKWGAREYLPAESDTLALLSALLRMTEYRKRIIE